ncbi:MAG: hypothetical protein LBM92_02555 [Opitutaceae bacterium]|nr:hypothetical protein [Opitutaceae bacterium]
MHARPLLLIFCLAALCAADARGHAFGTETNYWPFWVGRDAPADPAPAPTRTPVIPAASWDAAGPLAFSRPLGPFRRDDGAVSAAGLRPLYMEKRGPDGGLTHAHFLYPFFNYTAKENGGYAWSVFGLINHDCAPAIRPAGEGRADSQFDVWPVYFSSQVAGSPEKSYRAVFPIYGSVHSRLLSDRITWLLWPLYARFETNDLVTTTVLWPFFRATGGGDNHGFAFWPFFGWKEKGNALRERYLLWPLIFRSERNLQEPRPSVKTAFLPFYYGETGPATTNRNYMLFFGKTHTTAPHKYDETRYFWPLLVQGRGERLRVNRWAPFYTHSKTPEREKTWVMWPLWKHTFWGDGQFAFERRQFALFLYHSTWQQGFDNPSPRPSNKTSVWPLYTSWSDGAGRRQIQALSPFEVFLPKSEPARLVWSPLFALYRYEQAAPGAFRHALLWNFVTYRREPDAREFHLGPLYSAHSGAGYKRHALLNGVAGLDRRPDRGWRPFLFKFRPEGPAFAKTAAAALSAPRPYKQRNITYNHRGGNARPVFRVATK